jgi:hypothetical protein
MSLELHVYPMNSLLELGKFQFRKIIHCRVWSTVEFVAKLQLVTVSELVLLQVLQERILHWH